MAITEGDNITEAMGQTLYTKLSIIGGVVSLLGVIFVLTTRGPGGGPMVILLLLSLLFAFLLSIVSIFIQIGGRLLGIKEFSGPRLLYTAVLIAAGIVFLVGLQTLRQLQLIDVVLMTVFELVLNFYLLRRF